MIFPLPLRLAMRELRGGIAGFRIFMLCLALGVAVIAGVGSLGAAIEAGLKADSRALLGGDVEFTLVLRTATTDELGYLEAAGAGLARGAAARHGAHIGRPEPQPDRDQGGR